MWAALNVQKSVASDGQVYLVAANNTSGQGRGGGIYKPGGEPMVQHVRDIPLE
jgi:hypothetical protein